MTRHTVTFKRDGRIYQDETDDLAGYTRRVIAQGGQVLQVKALPPDPAPTTVPQVDPSTPVQRVYITNAWATAYWATGTVVLSVAAMAGLMLFLWWIENRAGGAA